MSDQRNRLSLLFAFSLTLLMVVAAGAANEDLRLVDAVKNQDLQEVRALLHQHADVTSDPGTARPRSCGPRIGTIFRQLNCWSGPARMRTSPMTFA